VFLIDPDLDGDGVVAETDVAAAPIGASSP
jgi:hypothetical protein